jgi:hypothetical protein
LDGDFGTGKRRASRTRAVLVTGATRQGVGTEARIQLALASVLPDRPFDAVTRRLLGA